MTRWFAILMWESRASWRQLSSSAATRHVIAATCVFVAAVLVIAAVARHDRLVAGGLTPLSGLIVVAALLATSATIRVATARIAGDDTKLRVADLAPLRPHQATLVEISPSVVATMLPVGLLALPFAVSLLIAAPLFAMYVAVAAVAVVLWSFTSALSSVVLCARIWGRRRGAQLARGASAVIALAVVVASRQILDLQFSSTIALLFCGASAAIPIVLWRSFRSYQRLLRQSDLGSRSAEPHWGSLSWWRLLRHTAAIPSALAGTMVLIWAQWLPDRLVISAIIAVAWVSVPVNVLLERERDVPMRWRLAPAASRARSSLGLQVAIPSLLIVTVFAAAIGWQHPAWLAAVALISVAQLATAFLDSRLLRAVISVGLLLAAAVVTSKLAA